MKFIKYFRLVVLCIVFQACKKNPTEESALSASLNVVNAITTDDANIKVNFTGKSVNYSKVIPHSYYNYDGKGNNNGANCYGMPAGIEIPLSIVMESDTLNPIYNETKQLNSGDFYTLYLAGQPMAIDHVLIKENIPLRAANTTGVRFVNLCKDCGPININVLDSPPGSFVSNLGYKSISEFKSLSASTEINSYDFQITNPSTGEELFYYTYWDLARMGNVTLILRGLWNGSVFLEVVRINNN